jgi:hypothetical protein
MPSVMFMNGSRVRPRELVYHPAKYGAVIHLTHHLTMVFSNRQVRSRLRPHPAGEALESDRERKEIVGESRCGVRLVSYSSGNAHVRLQSLSIRLNSLQQIKARHTLRISKH